MQRTLLKYNFSKPKKQQYFRRKQHKFYERTVFRNGRQLETQELFYALVPLISGCNYHDWCVHRQMYESRPVLTARRSSLAGAPGAWLTSDKRKTTGEKTGQELYWRSLHAAQTASLRGISNYR